MPEARRRRVSSTPRSESGRSLAANAPSDPNAPKRGLSAYMFFANAKRDDVRKENPGISFGEYRRHPANGETVC